MRRMFVMVLGIALLGIGAGAAETDSVDTDESRELCRASWKRVVLRADLPDDLLSPEGRNRWDLRAVATHDEFERSLVESGDRILDDRSRSREKGVTLRSVVSWSDPTGADGVRRWLRPHENDDLLSTRFTPTLRLDRQSEEQHASFDLRSRRVGAGWLHLPSGPREVVLHRVIVEPVAEGSVKELVHRWIDPRFGVVAEVRGPLGSDGRRVRVSDAAVVDRIAAGAVPLKIYSSTFDVPVFSRVNYGLDRGVDTPISSLTPEGHATIDDLVNAGQWDFSGNTIANSVRELATTTVPINEEETCNHFRCGFTTPGQKLGRDDSNFEDPENLGITLSATELEQRESDITIWLRGGVRNEGVTGGGLGESESRFCFTDEVGAEVPLWRFSHEDAGGFYYQDGDSWTHEPFQCELNLFNHICPSVACGFGCAIYSYACDDLAGTQSNVVLDQGPITLPSGHTFEALLVRNLNEFCVSIFANCSFTVDKVRTVIHLWTVPNIGTVARLMSAQFSPDTTSYTTVAETDLKYGLFPPVSITVGNVGSDSIEISWNPGNDVRRIDGYKVYWDTDSGVDSPYAFNSVDHSGQVVIDGTSATISGLASGTEYHVTVTTLSDYTDVATSVVTSYESALFPVNVSPTGDPVPAEVSATTEAGGCTPTAEVTGVTVDRSGGGIQICWDEITDPCADRAEVLGSATATSDGGFAALLESVPGATCETLTPIETFFLIISKGSGGSGPWGHYGR